MNVLIVIVNYRSHSYTIQALSSLHDDLCLNSHLSIIVVDNKSNDGSVEALNGWVQEQGLQSRIRVVESDKNGGFAYGNNIGIKYAFEQNIHFDYVLLLNPDTIVKPGTIAGIAAWMSNSPKVGILGCGLENESGLVECGSHRFPTILSEFARGLNLGLFTRIVRPLISTSARQHRPHATDWVSGACFMIRKDVIRDIGLMDDGYFLYYEEVDYCFKAKRKGWEVWYNPEFCILHLESKVTGLNSYKGKRIPGYWFESRRRFFRENYGLWYAMVADAAWLIGHLLWRIRILVQGKNEVITKYILRDYLRNLAILHELGYGSKNRGGHHWA